MKEEITVKCQWKEQDQADNHQEHPLADKIISLLDKIISLLDKIISLLEPVLVDIHRLTVLEIHLGLELNQLLCKVTQIKDLSDCQEPTFHEPQMLLISPIALEAVKLLEFNQQCYQTQIHQQEVK
jgi:hypothetical protein